MAPLKETEAAKKHNLEGPNPLHEMVPAHRAAVRDALRELGFLGLTVTGDDREADLRKLADTTDELQRGMITYAMGHAERGRDNCTAAQRHWSEARKLILPSTKLSLEPANKQRRDLGFLFFGRIRVGEMYCELMSGHAMGVAAKLQNAMVSMWAAKDAERAEVWLAWAIALYETGDQEQGRQLLLQAARHNAKLRNAVETYARAVGLDLATPIAKP
jgi:hypothetical protein